MSLYVSAGLQGVGGCNVAPDTLLEIDILGKYVTWVLDIWD